MIIVATETNRVYALNASTGSVIWQRSVGAPVTSGLRCGNTNPLGITCTPVVDLGSRSLFFDAMISGATIKHLIFSLNVDTGATRSGWPVDVNAKARYNGLTFTSSIQNQRGALGLVNGVVYVPYSGNSGDCGNYRGWVVGVPINNPSTVTAWATRARGGGIWGHGGVASAGTNGAVHAIRANESFLQFEATVAKAANESGSNVLGHPVLGFALDPAKISHVASAVGFAIGVDDLTIDDGPGF